MINVKIKIGDGEVVDTFDKYGLCYLSSDSRFDAGIKGFESSAYPEEEGEHTDAKTVASAFDYKVTFLVAAKGSKLDAANELITAFNKALYDETQVVDSATTGTAARVVRKYKQVEFYNTYKKVKIVGIPKPLETAKEFWRDKFGQVADAVQVEFTIRVVKPSLCNFSSEE